jgi:uncharacterized protein YggE
MTDQRRITIQGNGSVSAPPDRVVLNFKDNETDKDYETCIRKLNESVEALRKDLEAVDIKRNEIKTSQFNITAEYDWNSGKRTFKGYRASHNLRLELSFSQQLLNKVLNAIARSRSDCELSLQFEVSESEELKRKAIEIAVANAKQNAETIASAANVSLGKIIAIDYGQIRVEIRQQKMNAFMRSAHFGVAEADIEPEDVKVEDNVTISWEILD